MSVNFTLSTDLPLEKRKTLRMTIIGDSGVGKSTVACRLLKHWNELCIQSQNFGKKNKFDLVARDVNMTLLNTAKLQIEPASLESDVFVFVYSIVSEESFKSVCDAREHIIKANGYKIPIIFLGNKTDISGSVDVMKRSSRNFVITTMWEHFHEEISAETDQTNQHILDEILSLSIRNSSKTDAVETTVSHDLIEQPKNIKKDKRRISRIKSEYQKLFHFKRR